MQLRNSKAGAVARVTIGGRPVSSLDNVRGRRDAEVATMEGKHAVSAALPGGRGVRDAEGSLGAQPPETVRELLHLSYSSSS
jgi:hypothetical protein